MAMHLFVSDRALIDPSKSLVNLESLDLRVGFLNRVMIESFVEPIEVIDRRDTRLSILYRAETGTPIDPSLILEDTLTYVLAEGEIYLQNNAGETVVLAQYPDLNLEVFETEVLPTDPVTISSRREFKLTMDHTKLSLEEQTIWEGLTDIEHSNILNIIEYLTYGTVSTDTAVDVNETLIGSTNFSGYLNGSVNIVNRRTIAKVFDVNIYRLIPRYATFEFVTNGTTLTFNIWLDREEFKNYYPLTTIINIIPPLDLPTLVDPSNLSDPISAAAQSRQFSDSILSPEIGDRDQSGLKVFTTRYINLGNTYLLSFGIVYRGRIPDDLEVRQAIGDYLIASGQGSQALWMQRFPDIFIKNIFYLIPMFDQIVELTNADIYPSIIDVPKVIVNFNKIVQSIPRIIEDHFELLTIAWDKLFIGVKADQTNEIFTILNAHNTYRDFSTTDIGFIEMSVEDRQWSIRLNQLIAKAAGEENSIEVATIFAGGYEWYSLIYGNNAYNVIKKPSYLQAIA